MHVRRKKWAHDKPSTITGNGSNSWQNYRKSGFISNNDEPVICKVFSTVFKYLIWNKEKCKVHLQRSLSYCKKKTIFSETIFHRFKSEPYEMLNGFLINILIYPYGFLNWISRNSWLFLTNSTGLYLMTTKKSSTDSLQAFRSMATCDEECSQFCCTTSCSVLP